MLSRIKKAFMLGVRDIQSMRISVTLTLAYAALLCGILVFTSLVTVIGLNFVLYHQAGIEIEISVKRTMEQLERGHVFNSQFAKGDPLLPGVVLRVTNEQGDLVYDTDSHYPPLVVVNRHIDKEKSLWAHPEMSVVTLKNAKLYYKTLQVSIDDRRYTAHFLKTITAETVFINLLEKSLIITNLIALVIALLTGYFYTKWMLRPLRDITNTVKSIEVDDLGKRVPVGKAEDELSELANTFNHMLDRVQGGFEQQKRFVSDASHELRTPITVILGYSDMLMRWGQTDKKVLEEGITAIHSESENMQQLVEKLLFLARADQKRQVLHKEIIHTEGFIDDVYRKMKLVCHNHTLELLKNDDAEIYGDKVTIRQMLRIFLDNSCKYTPEGGRITISSELRGNVLHMELADNGIGIPKDQQEKVFQRFYRVDTSRTKVGNGVAGTGLGLSIARWICESHDIKISMESEPGQGTKILLDIPLAKDEEKLFEEQV